MKVFVVVSISLMPSIVEVFTEEKKANMFALLFKIKTGHTLDVKPRETDTAEIL